VHGGGELKKTRVEKQGRCDSTEGMKEKRGDGKKAYLPQNSSPLGKKTKRNKKIDPDGRDPE